VRSDEQSSRWVTELHEVNCSMHCGPATAMMMMMMIMMN